MSEKKFRVRFEQEDGKGEIVNEKGVELTAREVVDCLNEQQATINEQKEAIEYLKTVIRYTIPNQMVADVFKEIGEEYE